jgi:TRAP-type C4-dicarboxylate transport system permease small subunit
MEHWYYWVIAAVIGGVLMRVSFLSDNPIDRNLKWLVVTIPRFIIGVAIIAGIAINVGNVIGRFLFLEPIIWAEEIMIYIMVWTVFVGAILVSYEGQHLKMDFFSIMLPTPYKEIVNCIATVCVLVVCLFVIPQNWVVVEMMAVNDQRSVVAEAPMVIPHFALLFGFVMIFIGIAVRFRMHITADFESEIDKLVADNDGEEANFVPATKD